MDDPRQLRRISVLEHDLGLRMPCSDPQCPTCTGISRHVEYDHARRSYRMLTIDNGVFVVNEVSAQIFDQQDWAIRQFNAGR
jgi:hypothetical protein